MTNYNPGDCDRRHPRLREQNAEGNRHAAGAPPTPQPPQNYLSPDLARLPAILALQSEGASFIVTSAKEAGNPITYASQGFLSLTGYSSERVLGRNCRFLQGPETDPAAVARLREAVENGRDVSVTLLNYRHDNTIFWNQILISAVRNHESGDAIYFVGVQHPVQGPPEDEGGRGVVDHGMDDTGAQRISG